MKLLNKIENLILNKNTTMLGVGPMSKNVVDSAIELSNKNKVPIMLIASRRQIECKELGGGYCNNWTTEEFSKYVKKKDKLNQIILCRDHGGPWQGNPDRERNLDIKKSMIDAKKSFMADIDNGFKIIHIDPSISNTGKLIPKEIIIKRLFHLYEFVVDYAKKSGKEILVEIGTEEQSGSTGTYEDLEDFLGSMKTFVNKKKLNFPTFIVIQSGTKVMETRNIGSFESPIRIKSEIPVEIQIFKVLEICKKYNIFMKEHNADYLNDDSLSWHPRIGIHATNVAPEYGVAETKALISIFEKYGDIKSRDEFISLAYKSKKWSKWMINKKDLKKDLNKAEIAGHYIFTNKDVIKLKKNFLQKQSISETFLNNFLKKNIKKSITRYLTNFNLI
tara:strand:+ start:2246 stop:3415 length:1170 start_codon:yes stop_codon:yes gene_type:complete